jgi:hypothetical protein
MKNVIRKKSVIVKFDFNTNQEFIFNKTKINFEDDQELRNVQLWGVQTFYKGTTILNEQLPPDNLFNGILINDPDYSLPLITKNLFQLAHLTLYDTKGVEFLKQAPFAIFQTIQNQWIEQPVIIEPFDQKTLADIVERDPKTFTGQKLDLQNSYIELATDGFSPAYRTPPFSIVIDFYYSRIDLDKEVLTKLNLN